MHKISRLSLVIFFVISLMKTGSNLTSLFLINVKLLRSSSDCWDPIWSKIPYHFPDSVLTILWRFQHYANHAPKLQLTPETSDALSLLSETPNNLQNPQPNFCLHYSVLVFLHSNLIFTSPSQFSSFHFWYIAPFQYSCSLVLASALPSYISASLLNSCDPL